MNYELLGILNYLLKTNHLKNNIEHGTFYHCLILNPYYYQAHLKLHCKTLDLKVFELVLTLFFVQKQKLMLLRLVCKISFSFGYLLNNYF